MALHHFTMVLRIDMSICRLTGYSYDGSTADVSADQYHHYKVRIAHAPFCIPPPVCTVNRVKL
jgi:hypothetical protein